MNMRTLLIGSVFIGVLALGAGVASAQEGRQPDRGGVRQALIELAVEQTGLEPRAIMGEMRQGVSLADLISANGGDVTVFIADVTELVSERINTELAAGTIQPERAERLLGNLETIITNQVNGEGRRPQQRQPVRNAAAGVLMDAVSEATGLQGREIVAQLRDGVTLAEVISANGGDPNVVVATALATATEAVNARAEAGQMSQEQADQMIERLESSFQSALEGEFRLPGRDGNRGGNRLERPVLALAAEQTGLTPEAIMGQIREGSSLADVLNANGVDTEAFINDVVTAAEEQAEARLARLREQLTNRINQPGGEG